MDEATEAFLDAWLDANVSHKYTKRPSSRRLAVLAQRCISDAAAAGILLASLEDVVDAIEEAIQDELNFMETLNAKVLR